MELVNLVKVFQPFS